MPLIQITLVALHADVIVSTVVLEIKHVSTLTNVQAAPIMTAMLIPIAKIPIANVDLGAMDSIVPISMNV